MCATLSVSCACYQWFLLVTCFPLERSTHMATDDRSTVVGVFEDRALAQRAIDELRFAGFTDDQIGYAVRNETVEEGNPATGEVEHDTRENTTKGVVAGGGVGGGRGAAAAGLLHRLGPAEAGGRPLGRPPGAAVGG